jgi:hypothetical protein
LVAVQRRCKKLVPDQRLGRTNFAAPGVDEAMDKTPELRELASA